MEFLIKLLIGCLLAVFKSVESDAGPTPAYVYPEHVHLSYGGKIEH